MLVPSSPEAARRGRLQHLVWHLGLVSLLACDVCRRRRGLGGPLGRHPYRLLPNHAQFDPYSGEPDARQQGEISDGPRGLRMILAQVQVDGGVGFQPLAQDLGELPVAIDGAIQLRGGEVRGNGLLHGLDVGDTELASNISKAAFERHLIVETCGAGDTTVKLLPPIVIDEDQLTDGLTRLGESVAQASAHR